MSLSIMLLGEFDDMLSGYPWTAKVPSTSRGGKITATVIAIHLKQVDLYSEAPTWSRTSVSSQVQDGWNSGSASLRQQAGMARNGPQIGAWVSSLVPSQLLPVSRTACLAWSSARVAFSSPQKDEAPGTSSPSSLRASLCQVYFKCTP